jgi:curli biogenesis system outer membrane secretion channel CsgG
MTMKKTRLITLLSVMAAIMIAVCSPADAKPTLAVKTFDNKTDTLSLNPPAQAVTDMMTTELFNMGKFNLVEREKLEMIAEEIKLSQSGLMDESTAPELGKIKGAKYQMTGAITVYYYKASGGAVVVPWLAGGAAAAKTAYVQLDLRVIDSSTAEVVYAARETGTATREAAGVATAFGGFASVEYGGILATATRDCVMKHVEKMKTVEWRE